MKSPLHAVVCMNPDERTCAAAKPQCGFVDAILDYGTRVHPHTVTSTMTPFQNTQGLTGPTPSVSRVAAPSATPRKPWRQVGRAFRTIGSFTGLVLAFVAALSAVVLLLTYFST